MKKVLSLCMVTLLVALTGCGSSDALNGVNDSFIESETLDYGNAYNICDSVTDFTKEFFTSYFEAYNSEKEEQEEDTDSVTFKYPRFKVQTTADGSFSVDIDKFKEAYASEDYVDTANSFISNIMICDNIDINTCSIKSFDAVKILSEKDGKYRVGVEFTFSAKSTAKESLEEAVDNKYYGVIDVTVEEVEVQKNGNLTKEMQYGVYKINTFYPMNGKIKERKEEFLTAFSELLKGEGTGYYTYIIKQAEVLANYDCGIVTISSNNIDEYEDGTTAEEQVDETTETSEEDLENETESSEESTETEISEESNEVETTEESTEKQESSEEGSEDELTSELDTLSKKSPEELTDEEKEKIEELKQNIEKKRRKTIDKQYRGKIDERKNELAEEPLLTQAYGIITSYILESKVKETEIDRLAYYNEVGKNWGIEYTDVDEIPISDNIVCVYPIIGGYVSELSEDEKLMGIDDSTSYKALRHSLELFDLPTELDCSLNKEFKKPSVNGIVTYEDTLGVVIHNGYVILPTDKLVAGTSDTVNYNETDIKIEGVVTENTSLNICIVKIADTNIEPATYSDKSEYCVSALSLLGSSSNNLVVGTITDFGNMRATATAPNIQVGDVLLNEQGQVVCYINSVDENTAYINIGITGNCMNSFVEVIKGIEGNEKEEVGVISLENYRKLKNDKKEESK